MTPSRQRLLPKLSPTERRRLIAEPGLPWKEWALGTGLKPWMGLLFLILDGWTLISIIEVGRPWALVLVGPVMVPVIYLNYLLWQFLWRRPSEGARPVDFRRTWLHPFYLGRWDPGYREYREGSYSNESSVDAREFL